MALGQEDSSSRGGSPGLRDGMLLPVPYSRISHCSMGWAQLPAGFGTWRWGESHRCLCLQNPTGTHQGRVTSWLNHRIVWIERDFKNHLLPPLPWQGHLVLQGPSMLL